MRCVIAYNGSVAIEKEREIWGSSDFSRDRSACVPPLVLSTRTFWPDRTKFDAFVVGNYYEDWFFAADVV